MRAIHNYAKKALDGNPNDSKVKEFYQEVKSKYDKYIEVQNNSKPLEEILKE